MPPCAVTIPFTCHEPVNIGGGGFPSGRGHALSPFRAAPPYPRRAQPHRRPRPAKHSNPVGDVKLRVGIEHWMEQLVKLQRDRGRDGLSHFNGSLAHHRTAALTAAAAVGLAEQVWRRSSRPSSIVNSMSCTSRWWHFEPLDRRDAPCKRARASAHPACQSAPASESRRPRPRPAHRGGTHRSDRFSPIEGLRVKHTPVAEPTPLFPKTIWTTLTAVPRSSGIS